MRGSGRSFTWAGSVAATLAATNAARTAELIFIFGTPWCFEREKGAVTGATGGLPTAKDAPTNGGMAAGKATLLYFCEYRRKVDFAFPASGSPERVPAPLRRAASTGRSTVSAGRQTRPRALVTGAAETTSLSGGQSKWAWVGAICRGGSRAPSCT